MPTDLDKIMQQGTVLAKQKNPGLFDDNPKTMPADVKPKTGAAKPVVPTAPKAWDQYQKVIDAHDQKIVDPKDSWDKAINYSNSLHLMKAVNGRYDKMLSNKDLDADTKETIKTLINSSKGAMDELVKISKGAGDPKLFEKYRNNANVADWDLGTMLAERTDSNYIYDYDTKKFADRDTFEKNNQRAKKKARWEDKSTSTQANPGGGGVNQYAGFTQMKNYTYRSAKLVKGEVLPLVTTWGKNSFNMFNSDDKVAGRYDADNRSKTLNFTKDALTFISKYGTQSGKKEKDILNKKSAKDHLYALNELGTNPDSKVAYDLQMEYVKNLAIGGKTNKVMDMVEDMGSYGAVYLYKRYKTDFGKKEKYYQGSKKTSVNLDMIDANIQTHNDYVASYKEDKLTARETAMLKFSGEAEAEAIDVNRDTSFWEEAAMTVNIMDRPQEVKDKVNQQKSLKQLAFHAAISNVGKIENYDQFIRNLQEQYKMGPGATFFGGGDRKIKIREDKTGKLYDMFKSKTNAVRGTIFYDEEDFNETMRPLYNNIVKTYKKEFSLLNDPKKLEKDIGQGNTANSVVYHDYVDMSLDKNGRMINTSTFKGGNVAKIFGMLKGQSNSINDTNITLINDQDLTNGEFSKANKYKLEQAMPSNKINYIKFFKDKDLSKMTVEFDRNSSLDGYSTYTFINQKTGKKLAMIAPASYIMENKEVFYKETSMTAPEAIFQKLGKRDLPDVDDMYKDAAIIQKNGMKYATFKFKDTDGLTVTRELKIGNVEIRMAEKVFLDYFKRLQELKNQNLNL